MKYRAKRGDVIQLVKHDGWEGYGRHCEGELAEITRIWKDKDGDLTFNFKWLETGKAAMVGRGLCEDYISDDGCWKFAYEHNAPKRQKEWLLKNI